MIHIYFAHPYIALLLLGIIALLGLASLVFKHRFIYTYSLGDALTRQGYSSAAVHERILRALWMFILVLIALVIARPQRRNVISTIRTDGVDIVLALDISDSMNIVDHPSTDKRRRIDIAKSEALNFIKKRHNDAIGLVLFAGYALSRCPLTLDKKIISDIIDQTDIGLLPAQATFLSTGLITAANRMKGSLAKSKIIILLTDGSPSQGDEDPRVAIEIAKQLGIKVYTIGIGADNKIPVWGVNGVEYVSTYNKRLLEEMAHQTGGAFFEASNSVEMRNIYQKIDSLEKTEHEMEQICKVYDVFEPLVIGALILIVVTLFLSTFVWFSL